MGAIEALLTAKGWERAAIVAAFVQIGDKHRHLDRDATSAASAREQFAAERHRRAQVQGHRAALREVLGDHRRSSCTPTPGEVVDLDGLGTFPPIKTKAQDILQQPVAVVTAMALSAAFRDKAPQQKACGNHQRSDCQRGGEEFPGGRHQDHR